MVEKNETEPFKFAKNIRTGQVVRDPQGKLAATARWEACEDPGILARDATNNRARAARGSAGVAGADAVTLNTKAQPAWVKYSNEPVVPVPVGGAVVDESDEQVIADGSDEDAEKKVATDTDWVELAAEGKNTLPEDGNKEIDLDPVDIPGETTAKVPSGGGKKAASAKGTGGSK